MKIHPLILSAARPLAALAVFGLLTGCACEQTTVRGMGSGPSPKGGDDAPVIDLNNPGPHQISVVIIKKNHGGSAQAGEHQHHARTVVQIEPDGTGHYNVTHLKKDDKDVD